MSVFKTARSASVLADEPEPLDFQTEKPDWALFRTLDGLGQKAGVSPTRLRRLALKELVDNALDAGAEVTIRDEGISYVIEDDGPGISGTPQQVADLFSINRVLRSSKQLRKPQRGALGNGLRVVAGALIASGGGRLIVSTRGNRLDITPLADGGASVRATPTDRPIGTKIRIAFGPDMPADPLALEWAEAAITMSQGGPGYDGKTSPHWFDAGAFYELVHWAGNRPVRELIAKLDGCTGAKAALVTGDLKGRTCKSLTRDETTALLTRARVATMPPTVKKLGAVGEIDALPYYYARKTGSIELGSREPKANLPFVVEAWAEAAKIETTVAAHVNRTPITGEVLILPPSDDKPVIWGCGLNHFLDIPKKGKWTVVVNVTIPFMPITTDGKEPNLELFVTEIVDAVQGAIKRAHKAIPRDNKGSVKGIVIANLADALRDRSGGGLYPVSQRQLFYAMRPIVMAALGRELIWENFTQIVTGYEAEHGELEGMYRDNRGVLYQPGTGQDVPVGTRMVEGYERPAWTFNKVVYIEKEALFEALKANDWPERHDCALLTSKGFASRAVKDILDGLAEHDEPIKVFCVHDADSAGTLIYQTLQEATRARGARAIEIVNLGLEPWEAEEMGLEAEPFKKGDKHRRPVADYVTQHPDGDYWTDWLQSHRYELDAMSTPQFLEWLTAKIEAHEVGKVIPPVEVIVDTTDEVLRSFLRKHIEERVLREANIDALVEAAFAAIERPDLNPEVIASWLAGNPNENWRASVEAAAAAEIKRHEELQAK